jgi:hypothetical protein
MDDFWNNILRYSRFFISSLTGLIFVILSPFKFFLKPSKYRIFFYIFILVFFVTLYNVIKNMAAF